ncbi:hypothetical protein PR003_g2073 [Phytophthora rubi]|uniref:Uncharacterized protein n=1 Tax=Phytophthora rubi TaxID=129364 RepID=A0A6A3NYX6_9STRA|nr:hypothetical protein PR002_g4048 [Phytophthora rubi]KAE9047978.1 hypothetical protein PR001_g3994 [Phytophthora rubi]KAE9356867.1 hypothetical protein PR003_g2073 [Phytophthora rubi]
MKARRRRARPTWRCHPLCLALSLPRGDSVLQRGSPPPRGCTCSAAVTPVLDGLDLAAHALMPTSRHLFKGRIFFYLRHTSRVRPHEDVPMCRSSAAPRCRPPARLGTCCRRTLRPSASHQDSGHSPRLEVRRPRWTRGCRFNSCCSEVRR